MTIVEATGAYVGISADSIRDGGKIPSRRDCEAGL